MNWTEPCKPKEGVSYYDHVIAETPLGKCIIKWKSWKESDSYSIILGDYYVGDEYSLEDAKERANTFLVGKRDELSLYLGT
jgi:hypothetical protein